MFELFTILTPLLFGSALLYVHTLYIGKKIELAAVKRELQAIRLADSKRQLLAYFEMTDVRAGLTD
jgi:hypothetical protein